MGLSAVRTRLEVMKPVPGPAIGKGPAFELALCTYPRLAERNGGCHRHRRPRFGARAPRDKRHRTTNFL